MAISEIGHLSLFLLIIIVILWVDRNSFWLIRKPFKSNITAVFVGWTNIHAAIKPFFMRNGKNCFIYLWQIRLNLFSWYVGEKHVGLDKKSEARQNVYYDYSAFLNSQLDLLQAWYLRRSFNLPPIFACSVFRELKKPRRRRRGRRQVKNEFIFYQWNLRLSRSLRFANGSKIVLKLTMQRRRSIPNGNTRN